jgi:DNA-binding FadR family transcriptional regulator
MSKKTRVDQTVHALTHYIAKNQLKPGDKLPNEYELCALLEVGRNTMREALRVLASRNILTIKQGAGTFIAQNTGLIEDPFGFSFTANPDKLVDDLMQIRIIVEPKIAALAAQNATDEDLQTLVTIQARIETAIEQEKDFSELDKRFHAHLSSICGNDVISKLIPIIAEGVSVYAKQVHSQETRQTVKSHNSIIQAIREKKPTEAESAMLYHLLYNLNRM